MRESLGAACRRQAGNLARRALLSALAVAAVVCLGAPPAAAAKGEPKAPKALKPSRIKFRPESDLQALLRERTGMSTDEQRRAAAQAAGPMTLTGSTTLSGVVLATDLTIAPGSSVVLQSGSTVIVAGDLRIEAPVTGAMRPLPPGAKRPPEPENEDTVFVVDGVLVVDEELRGADGEAGLDVEDSFPARGGDGRRGQGFAFYVAGRLVVRADVIPGRGGDGGRCDVRVDGVSGADVSATGGNGGRAGGLSIVAHPEVGLFVEIDGGKFHVRRGGKGGDALCISGDGGESDGFDPACTKDGGRAGTATAFGGNGGPGTTGGGSPRVTFVRANETALPPGEAVALLQEDTELFGVLGGQGTATPRVLGSTGGDATATGGDGGTPPDCVNQDGECPARGRAPGEGGRGGSAAAFGGQGGEFPVLLFSERSFETGTAFGFSFGVFASAGGSVYALGGDGGQGGDAAAAKRPAAGGRGGSGGTARVKAGLPGNVPLVFGVNGAVAFNGRSVLPRVPPLDLDEGDFRSLVYHVHGEIDARGGNAGPGGRGGDCCGRPGGRGGAGGPSGLPGAAVGGLQPRGVEERVGPGVYVLIPGQAAAAGQAGAGCESDPGLGGGTLGDPFRPPTMSLPCSNLNAPDDPGLGFNFYLPGTTEALLPLPRSTLLEFQRTLFGPATDLRVEVFINGLLVMDQFFPDVGKLALLPPFYVRTPGSGTVCVEIRFNGVVRQRQRFMLQ